MPLPLTERATTATVLSGLISTLEGSESSAGGERLVVQLPDRGLDRRGGDVVGLDHGHGRDGAAGERGLDAVVGLDHRLAARVAVEARAP